ncbi:MAG: hypothetical protein HZB68_05405 [Candidatus Aenigmarchaeota archaeon]|nr:hypothetical protein [Candidatus Aenigmarchaeota archaeon]
MGENKYLKRFGIRELLGKKGLGKLEESIEEHTKMVERGFGDSYGGDKEAAEAYKAILENLPEEMIEKAVSSVNKKLRDNYSKSAAGHDSKYTADRIVEAYKTLDKSLSKDEIDVGMENAMTFGRYSDTAEHIKKAYEATEGIITKEESLKLMKSAVSKGCSIEYMSNTISKAHQTLSDIIDDKKIVKKEMLKIIKMIPHFNNEEIAKYAKDLAFEHIKKLG